MTTRDSLSAVQWWNMVYGKDFAASNSNQTRYNTIILFYFLGYACSQVSWRLSAEAEYSKMIELRWIAVVIWRGNSHLRWLASFWIIMLGCGMVVVINLESYLPYTIITGHLSPVIFVLPLMHISSCAFPFLSFLPNLYPYPWLVYATVTFHCFIALVALSCIVTATEWFIYGLTLVH